MTRKTIDSFTFSLKGLLSVWKEERNFRIATFAGALVVILMIYFDFSSIEKLFCIIAITLVLCAEIINTVIEDLCNRVEPHTDHVIAKIKDMSSSFVLVASLGALVVGILVFFNHFS